MAEREQKRALIWLTNTKGMGLRSVKKLLQAGFTPGELLQNFKHNKKEITAILGSEMADKLELTRDDKLIDDILREMQAKKVEIIPYFDAFYPPLLTETADPPVLLYCIGDKTLLKTKCIGVVGSREVTRYGREVTEMFAKGLAESGVTVVSGLARGVDKIAHRAALAAKGKTIAVLGAGIDVCYPSENFELYNEIAEKGLLISEYPIGTKPNAYQFPERNRIISGISSGILVTEAGEKSGSLITANCALEDNRALFLVPGNINSKTSVGCNFLLKHVQGALVTEVNDILAEIGVKKREEQKVEEIQLDVFVTKVYEYLQTKDAHFDELCEVLEFSPAELNGILMQLEINGLIKTIKTNFYGV